MNINSDYTPLNNFSLSSTTKKEIDKNNNSNQILSASELSSDDPIIFDNISSLLSYDKLKPNNVYYTKSYTTLNKYTTREKSRNLLSFNEFISGTTTGVYITRDDDNYIILNGENTVGGRFIKLCSFPKDYVQENLIGKTLTVSAERIYSPSDTGSIGSIGFGTNTNYNSYKMSQNETIKTYVYLNEQYDLTSDTIFYFGLSKGTYTNYKIRIQLEVGDTATEYSKNNQPIPNNITIFEKNNIIIEQQFINNIINIRELGAQSFEEYGGKLDLKPYIDKFITLSTSLQKLGIVPKLFIPSGTWFTSPIHINISNFILYGSNEYPSLTCITALNDTQQYLIKLGGDSSIDGPITNLIRNCSIKNLTLTSGFRKSGYNLNTGNGAADIATITDSLLFIDGVTYSSFKDLYFYYFTGHGLSLRSSWELYFGILNFRSQYNFYYASLIMRKAKPVSGTPANISAVEFQSLMFEGVNDDCIYAEPGSGFTHNEIVNINVEEGFTDWSNVRDYTNTDDISTMKRHFVFRGMCRNNSICNITYVNNNSSKIYNDPDGISHMKVGIFGNIFDNSISSYDNIFALAVGSVSLRGNASSFCPRLYYEKSGINYFNGLTIGALVSNYNGDTLACKGMIDISRGLTPAIGAMNLGGTKEETYSSIINLAYKYATSLVKFDDESIGCFKLVASRNSENNTILNIKTPFVYNKNLSNHKIILRVKVPNGEIANLKCGWITSKIEGTGYFQEYSYEINNSGKIFSVSCNDNQNIAIDAFWFVY